MLLTPLLLEVLILSRCSFQRRGDAELSRIRHLAGVALDRVADLAGVAAADGLDGLAVPQQDEEGDRGHVVGLGDVGVLFGVDGEEGDGLGGLDGVGGCEGGEDGVHLFAGRGPGGVEGEDEEGEGGGGG